MHEQSGSGLSSRSCVFCWYGEMHDGRRVARDGSTVWLVDKFVNFQRP